MKGTHCEVFDIGTLGISGISEPSGTVCPFIDTTLEGIYVQNVHIINSILPTLLEG